MQSTDKQNDRNEVEQDELDQADELRKLFLDVEGKESTEFTDTASETKEEDGLVLRKIDILQLPPRKEVHQTNKRVKLKVSRPLMRFVFFSIIVIAVIIGAIFLLDGEWNLIFT